MQACNSMWWAKRGRCLIVRPFNGYKLRTCHLSHLPIVATEYKKRIPVDLRDQAASSSGYISVRVLYREIEEGLNTSTLVPRGNNKFKKPEDISNYYFRFGISVDEHNHFLGGGGDCIRQLSRTPSRAAQHQHYEKTVWKKIRETHHGVMGVNSYSSIKLCTALKKKKMTIPQKVGVFGIFSIFRLPDYLSINGIN